MRSQLTNNREARLYLAIRPDSLYIHGYASNYRGILTRLRRVVPDVRTSGIVTCSRWIANGRGFGIWYLAFSIWHLAFGTWHREQEFSPRRQNIYLNNSLRPLPLCGW
jgi:hypothetical protein